MILAIRDRMEKRDEGFTLIELLVVVIIIGILAAVAIPVFLRQREKAWDSAAHSELRNSATAQESYYTANSSYAANVGALADEGFADPAGKSVTAFTSTGTASSYCSQATSKSATVFSLDSSVGTVQTGACGAGDPE